MRVLFAITALVIIYGSLFPFNFTWPAFSQIAWFDWLTTFEHRTTNGDKLSNLLIFIPLTFFAFFEPLIKHKKPYLKFVLILVLSLSFAYALQFLQFFTQNRVPSAGDVWFNGWGALIGIAAAWLFEYWLSSNQQLKKNWFKDHAIACAILILAGLFLLFPYFIQLNLSTAINGVESLWMPPLFNYSNFVVLFGVWLAIFVLLDSHLWFKLTNKQAFILVASVLILRVLTKHIGIDVEWIIAIALAWLAKNYISAKWQNFIVLTALIIAYLADIFLPWQVKTYAININYVLLNGYLSGSLWENTYQFLKLTFFYSSLLYFAYQVFKRWMLSAIVIMLLVTVVELLQQYYSLGKPDVSEIIIVLILSYFWAHLQNVSLTTIKS